MHKVTHLTWMCVQLSSLGRGLNFDLSLHLYHYFGTSREGSWENVQIHKLILASTWENLSLGLRKTNVHTSLRIGTVWSAPLTFVIHSSGLQINVCIWNSFFLFLQQNSVVGTQKNCLNDMALLSTQNTCLNWWIRKYSQFYNQKFYLSGLMFALILKSIISKLTTREFSMI